MSFKFSLPSVQTGDPCQSFPPWPAPQSIGGGAVIPCLYSVKVKDGREKDVYKILELAVNAMKERSVLHLKM